MDSLWAAIAALIPSIGVGILFWFVMRTVIRADRNERLAVARMEAEEDARTQAESKERD